MLSLRLGVLAVSVLGAAWPAPALAGTVTRTAAGLVFQADPATGASDDVSVGIENGKPFIASTQNITVFPGDCAADGPMRIFNCGAAPAFVVNLLGFDDSASGSQVTGPMALEAHGGDGDDGLSGTSNGDRLYGDGGSDTLSGGFGNDIIDGGAGPDYGIDDGPGEDTVTGGFGADSFKAGTGRDTYQGGEGEDQVDYQDRTAAVTITLDDVADDGEAGEGDNVASDIEDAVGGSGDDRIVGNAADNRLGGGAGNDAITPGAGQDYVDAGSGNDVLDVRDGGYDSVDCGPGIDTVTADQSDSLRDCENVSVPDADGDGYLPPADCNNTDATIHPGALDAVGDGIDQDCDGRDQPPPRVINPVGFDFKYYKSPRSARVLRLRVTEVQMGDRIEVRCTGKGCAFAKRTRTGRRGHPTENLLALFKGRKLRQGAVIEVRIVRTGYIGKVVRLKIGKQRTSSTGLCLPVGATKPRSCV